jgi:hypothetical protein
MFKPRYEVKSWDPEIGKPLGPVISKHFFHWTARRACESYESMRIRMGFNSWYSYIHDTKEVKDNGN